jgi:hypothetical protein
LVARLSQHEKAIWGAGCEWIDKSGGGGERRTKHTGKKGQRSAESKLQKKTDKGGDILMSFFFAKVYAEFICRLFEFLFFF